MSIRFNHVGIHVRDLDTSVRFLEAVLGGAARTIRLRDDVALVGTEDGVYFDLIAGDWGAAPKDHVPYGVIHYALGVKDVDAAYAAALAAGAEEMHAPQTGGWGVRTAFVYDPNGDVCEFVEDTWPVQAEAWLAAQRDREDQ